MSDGSISIRCWHEEGTDTRLLAYRLQHTILAEHVHRPKRIAGSTVRRKGMSDITIFCSDLLARSSRHLHPKLHFTFGERISKESWVSLFKSTSYIELIHFTRHQDFEPSTVSSNTEADLSLRSSSSAMLPSDDSVIRCIAKRAAKFQGHIPLSRIETLQLVRYRPGESYKFHNDWDIGDPPGSRRSSTFFAYVGCEGCVGGSTRFYYLSREGLGKKWCDVIDCNESSLKGVKFLPIEGNAVFWENLEDGDGIEEVLHAGTALEEGVKYGLNIWTRETADF